MRTVRFIVPILVFICILPGLALAKPSLSNEQIFLHAVYKNRELIEQNPDWKKIGDGAKWELIIPDFSYNGIRENVRFVGQKNLNRQGEFFLVIYKLEDDTWVPRYGTKSDGIPQVVATFNRATGSFVMNITPLNVAEKFKIAKIETDNDLDETNERIANRAMIQTLDQDIHHRNLVEQVFGITQETAKNGLRKKYPYIAPGDVDQDGLIKQTAKNSLYGSLYGLLMIRDAFEGFQTDDQIKSYLSTPPHETSAAAFVAPQSEYMMGQQLQNSNPTPNSVLSAATVNSVAYKKIKDDVVKNYISMNRPRRLSTTSEADLFNGEIRNISDICENLKIKRNKELNSSQKNHQYTITPQNEYVADLQMQKDVAIDAKIDEAYGDLAYEGAKPHLDFLNQISPLSALWASKTFENSVGHFDAWDCISQGKNYKLGQVHDGIIREAVTEIKKLAFDAINQNVKIIDSASGTYTNKTLKKMIRSSPLAIQTALHQRNVVVETAYVAQNIEEIYSNDQFNNYVDMTIMGVGFATGILGGALTGGLSTVAVGVMFAADAVSLQRGAYDWYDAYFIEGKVRQSMIAGQIDPDQAQETLKQAQDQKSAGMANVAMTLGGNVVGFGIGSAISKGKSAVATEVKDATTTGQAVHGTKVSDVTASTRGLKYPSSSDEIADYTNTIENAEKVLGRELNSDEKILVYNAHIYGRGGEGKIKGTTATIDNYRTEVNAVKLKIATGDGKGTLTMEEAKTLADAKVIGDKPLKPIADISEVKLQNHKFGGTPSKLALKDAYENKKLVNQFIANKGSTETRYFRVKGYTADGDLIVEFKSAVSGDLVQREFSGVDDITQCYLPSKDEVAVKAPWFGVQKRIADINDLTTIRTPEESSSDLVGIYKTKFGDENSLVWSNKYLRYLIEGNLSLDKYKTAVGIDKYIQREGHYFIAYKDGGYYTYGRILNKTDQGLQIMNSSGNVEILKPERIETAILLDKNEAHAALQDSKKLRTLGPDEPQDRVIESDQEIADKKLKAESKAKEDARVKRAPELKKVISEETKNNDMYLRFLESEADQIAKNEEKIKIRYIDPTQAMDANSSARNLDDAIETMHDDYVHEGYIVSIDLKNKKIAFAGTYDEINERWNIAYTKDYSDTKTFAIINNPELDQAVSQAAKDYFGDLKGSQKKTWSQVQKDVLNKKSYAKIDRAKTQNILYKAHVTGSVKETPPGSGVFKADGEKMRALVNARKELQGIGYSETDADQIIKKLSDPDVMILGKRAKTADLHQTSLFVDPSGELRGLDTSGDISAPKLTHMRSVEEVAPDLKIYAFFKDTTSKWRNLLLRELATHDLTFSDEFLKEHSLKPHLVRSGNFKYDGHYHISYRNNGKLAYGRIERVEKNNLVVTSPDGKTVTLRESDTESAVLLSRDDKIIAPNGARISYIELFDHPKLFNKVSPAQKYFNELKGDQAIIWKYVQENIISKYPRIDQSQVIEILYKAHMTGESNLVNGVRVANMEKVRALVTAKQELQKLGVWEEDANAIIKTLADKNVMVLGYKKRPLEELWEQLALERQSESVEKTGRWPDTITIQFKTADTAEDLVNAEIQNGTLLYFGDADGTIMVSDKMGNVRTYDITSVNFEKPFDIYTSPYDQFHLVKFKVKYPEMPHFNTKETPNTKSFRKLFVMNDLSHGDIIDVFGKELTVDTQRGSLVAVIDGTETRLMTQDEIEYAELIHHSTEATITEFYKNLETIKKVHELLQTPRAENQHILIRYQEGSVIGSFDHSPILEGYLVGTDLDQVIIYRADVHQTNVIAMNPEKIQFVDHEIASVSKKKFTTKPKSEDQRLFQERLLNRRLDPGTYVMVRKNFDLTDLREVVVQNGDFVVVQNMETLEMYVLSDEELDVTEVFYSMPPAMNNN